MCPQFAQNRWVPGPRSLIQANLAGWSCPSEAWALMISTSIQGFHDSMCPAPEPCAASTRTWFHPQKGLTQGFARMVFPWRESGSLGEVRQLEAKPSTVWNGSLPSPEQLSSLGTVLMASGQGCNPHSPILQWTLQMEWGSLKRNLREGVGRCRGHMDPCLRVTPSDSGSPENSQAPWLATSIAPCQLFYFGFSHTQEREKSRKQQVEGRARKEDKLGVPWVP